jgi:coenzyme F420-reducing hydrogenase beta subunit
LPGIQHRTEAGYCLSTYYGHANEPTRLNGASGGLATWFLQTLLRNGVVDHVVCVKPTDNPDQLFKFGVFSTPEEIARCSKSAYYPVEVSEAIQTILKTDARYAVVGLPCVVKSLRLAQKQIPLLKRRIVVVAGLVCGQTKSKFFAEYLVSHMGLAPKQTCYLSFRTKNPQRPASNFEVHARTTDGQNGVCLGGAAFMERLGSQACFLLARAACVMTYLQRLQTLYSWTHGCPSTLLTGRGAAC